MSPPKIQTHWEGGCCCHFRVEGQVGPLLFRRLAAVAKTLREGGKVEGAVSSYGSLAIYWSVAPADPMRLEGGVMDLLAEAWAGDLEEDTRPHYRVPVRYVGEDLSRVAQHVGVDENTIVARHKAVTYTVAAVGFVPHFAYLWGLDGGLATPRIAAPRATVPLGSVGIGGGQTGVYPKKIPGGWNLIGSVDEDIVREICPALRVGDEVRFDEIL